MLNSVPLGSAPSSQTNIVKTMVGVEHADLTLEGKNPLSSMWILQFYICPTGSISVGNRHLLVRELSPNSLLFKSVLLSCAEGQQVIFFPPKLNQKSLMD